MIYAPLLFAVAVVQSSLAATLNPMTTVTSQDGALETSITVDQFFFEEAHTGTKLWTRAYSPETTSGDTLHPGPVLRFKRGDTVTVTLNNNLGPETEETTDMNSYHYANTTNLHTHGLHVSAESPQDNVLITISPQGKHICSVFICSIAICFFTEMLILTLTLTQETLTLMNVIINDLFLSLFRFIYLHLPNFG
jgi:hypothetical protein